MDRAALEAEWLDLTRRRLPGVAGERGWPIRFDHCFQRVLLDHACQGVWYDRIEGRPAYKKADDSILSAAVEAGRAVLSGEVDLPVLNRQSLDWRGKAGPKRKRPG